MEGFFQKSLKELEDQIKGEGFEKFRAKQLFSWVYDKKTLDLEQMGNLNKKFKDFIQQNFIFRTIKILEVKEEQGKRDAIKFLLELDDKETIEMVIMRYLDSGHSKVRNTLCISSQVGCVIGCPFCATGKEGLTRNLKTSEIMEQIFLANEFLAQEFQEKITNVVFMGMGEPLFNRANVFKACKLIGENFSIGERKIVISTSGDVEGIKALEELDRDWVLAISLHGTNNSLRDELVPINKKYPLEKLMKACKDYQRKTKRRITFEYIMIHNKNIQKENAEELAKLLKGIACHINGIRLNKISGSDYIPATKKEIENFRKLLEERHLSFSQREKKGREIDGACGQLKNSRKDIV